MIGLVTVVGLAVCASVRAQPAPGGGGGFGGGGGGFGGGGGGFGGGGGGFGGGGFGGGGGPGGPGGGQGGGGFNLQAIQDQIKQNAMDNLRTRLGLSDDEFAAVQPLLTKVIADNQAVNVGSSAGVNGMQNIANAFRNARNGGAPGGPGGGVVVQGGGQGGPGGGGGGGRQAFISILSSPYGIAPSDTQNQVQKALDDLNQVLADTNATPDSIQAKMDAYRDAKLKAIELLEKDTVSLKQVLTAKQEATLLSMGLVK
jgi:hypothetical protein